MLWWLAWHVDVEYFGVQPDLPFEDGEKKMKKKKMEKMWKINIKAHEWMGGGGWGVCFG